jgi:hypothetical protein
MNTLYSSKQYHVIEYPGHNAYEVIDKQLGVGGYLQGELASSFAQSLAEVIAEDPTDDRIDEFLGSFNALMTQPVSFH